MVVISISGPNNSVTISTGGRLFLLDRSLSQYVSAVEFAPAYVLVMSGCTHPNEEFNQSWLFHAHVVKPQSFSVIKYLERDLKCLDLDALAGCGPMKMSCKCGIISAFVVIQMSLDVPNAGIFAAVEVVLVVVVLARRCVCHSCSITKKGSTSADWSI